MVRPRIVVVLTDVLCLLLMEGVRVDGRDNGRKWGRGNGRVEGHGHWEGRGEGQGKGSASVRDNREGGGKKKSRREVR